MATVKLFAVENVIPKCLSVPSCAFNVQVLPNALLYALTIPCSKQRWFNHAMTAVIIYQIRHIVPKCCEDSPSGLDHIFSSVRNSSFWEFYFTIKSRAIYRKCAIRGPFRYSLAKQLVDQQSYWWIARISMAVSSRIEAFSTKVAHNWGGCSPSMERCATWPLSIDNTVPWHCTEWLRPNPSNVADYKPHQKRVSSICRWAA